jgi:prepilin peptidase CpaA
MWQAGYPEAMAAVLVPATLFAGWNDYRFHRVPNWLCALVVGAGLAAQTFWNGGAGALAGLEGMLVGFGVLVGLWLIRGMGAGDVKLMAALGAWLGPQLTLAAIAVGGVLGGVMALALVARQRAWAQMSANVGVLMMNMRNWRAAFGEVGSAASANPSTGVIPYAIPLCLGAWFVVANRYFGWWGLL